MILVPLFNFKSLIELAACGAETSNQQQRRLGQVRFLSVIGFMGFAILPRVFHTIQSPVIRNVVGHFITMISTF
jgi:hypothetical protein